MSFENKVVVVTGAASGIGKAVATQLARAGAHVFALDIDTARGQNLAREAASRAEKVTFLPVDLAEGSYIDTCCNELLQQAGKVDVLVNTAGWDQIQPFVENSAEFTSKVLAINLEGALHLTRRLLPTMMAAKAGKIVNVASDAGRVGSMGETVYAAAKGGLIAFTKSLSRESARYGINVNCVCPGPTDTPFFHAGPEKLKEALVKAIPFRRLAKPDEIADAIIFFAGPNSDYITGQILSVSGGLTMVG